MKVRSSRLAAFILGALALSMIGGAQVGASPGGRAQHGSAVILTFDPDRRATPAALAQPLAAVADAARRRGASAGVRAARARALDVSGTRIRVVLEGGTAVGDAVRASGGSVEARSGRLVEALVPAASLTSLAAAPAVEEVRTPYLARPQATMNEALLAMNAGRAHVAGNLGAGVKVAIIDGGFGDLAASQVRGDLPHGVTTKDFCGGALGAPEDHGTAVAENVHAIAPAASLYLVCTTSEVTLANAVAYVKSQSVDIVVHSIGWFNTSRGDGSGAVGTPDALVADARGNGILWVNAAGNQAESHWGGQFADSDGNGFHNFAGGDELNEFIVPAGATACVAVKWDAWPTTTEDYDLYIFRSADTSLPYAGSVADQSTSAGPPTEETCFTNSTSATQAFGFALDKYSGTSATPQFDVFVLDVGDIEYPVVAGSAVEPATSPAAVAVGAVCWDDLLLQPYSAQGPTIDGRTKPDLVAPDRTSSGIYGAARNCDAGGFAGTSSSAPHAAGLAALLKSGDPSLTVSQLAASLLGKSLDVHALGADDRYGAGLAWLPSTGPALANGASISFVRGIQGGRDLWTSGLDGSNPVNITPGSPFDESFSAWSPDGSQLTFSNPWTNVANADGTRARRGDGVGIPEWSNNGDRLAIVDSGYLKVGPAAGGPPLALGSVFSTTSGVSWSPDDTKIYGVSGGDVHTVEPDGTDKTLVAATTPSEEWIALSPDGTKIAYTALSGGAGTDRRVYVVGSTMSGTPLELTVDQTFDEVRPRWSPDGTAILYTRYPTTCCGKSEVWRVGANGTPAPQAVTTGADYEWFGDWQPLVHPIARQLPFVQGTPVVGSTLTALTSFGGSAPISLAYGWQRCNAAGGACVVTGVTTMAYPLGAADIGSRLQAFVAATNGAGNTFSLSVPTAIVAAAPAQPPSGGGGGGGGGVGPDIQVSLVASNANPSPNDVVEIRASVFNDSSNLAARDLRATIGLPAGTTLLGSPAFTTGSGCAGSPTIQCFLDYLSPKSTSVVRFSINVGAAGSKSITLATTMSVGDPNLANNAGSLTLNVKAPAVPTPREATPRTATRSFTGTNQANVIRGTSAANLIRGLGGNDRLYGNGGNDRLLGGAGNDWISGGSGRDVLIGGTGNDTHQARDRGRDTVDCGPGRDVAVVDRVDKVARNCETVRRG